MNPSVRFSHIVATSQNNAIGYQGKLPWHIPEDLKFFSKTTKNHIVLMGRKTWESFKGSLPQRLNVIVTRKTDYKVIEKSTHIIYDLKTAIKFCETTALSSQNWGKEIFIIGGEQIYKQSLPWINTIYLTRIHQKVKGDTFYPVVDKTQFKLTQRQDHFTASTPFSFLTYQRK